MRWILCTSLPARRSRKASPKSCTRKVNEIAVIFGPMNMMANPTVKSALMLGAATLGAVAIFVGPEESGGILAETAGSSSQDAELGPPSLQSNAEPSQMQLPAQPEEPEPQAVEWGDEDLIDNTAGFDPTPTDESEFSAGPTDDTIDDTDPELEIGEGVDQPMIAPTIGGRVPANLLPG